jgi:hypothetical protein
MVTRMADTSHTSRQCGDVSVIYLTMLLYLLAGEYTPFRASQEHQIPVIYRATEWSPFAANSEGRPTQVDTTQLPDRGDLSDVIRFESRRAHHFP